MAKHGEEFGIANCNAEFDPIRHHGTCWHQSVRRKQERLSSSAKGWSFSTWQPRPVSFRNRRQLGGSLENSDLAWQYRYVGKTERSNVVSSRMLVWADGIKRASILNKITVSFLFSLKSCLHFELDDFKGGLMVSTSSSQFWSSGFRSGLQPSCLCSPLLLPTFLWGHITVANRLKLK